MIRIRIGCPDSNSIRRADENFESAAHTVCRQTTNYAHSLFNKNFGPFVCSWDICLQLHFTCSCTAVARAHTQVPHDNRHWTCKRLPLILFEIRFERKFPIRRSISWKQTSHTHTHARARNGNWRRRQQREQRVCANAKQVVASETQVQNLAAITILKV